MNSGARARALFERFGLLVILAAAALLHVQLARPFLSPLFLRDESGYLANAAALAGYTFDGASSYRAGYSLLLAPLYFLFDDTFVIYRSVQALNIGLCLVAIVLLDRLLSELFPDQSRAKRLLALLVAAAYPAWSSFSTFAFCENAFVPVFVLSCLLCFRVARVGGWSWLAWGVAIGYLIMVTPRASTVALSGLLVGIAIAMQRRDGKGFAVFLAGLLAVVAIDRLLLEPFVLDRLTVGEYPPDLRYPTLAWLFAPLWTLHGIRSLAIHTLAHAAYLLMGTLWLAWFATLYVVRRFNESRSQREFPADVLVLIYVLVAVIGTLGVSALHFASYKNALRLDQWMYGRYVEAVLMPLLAAGFVALRPSRFVFGFALAWLCARIFVSGAEIRALNPINVSALWQMFQLPHWTAPCWCVAAGALTLVIIYLPYSVRAVAFAIVFALTSVQLHKQNLEVAFQQYALPHRLASDLRSSHAPGPDRCIGYDEPSVPNLSTDSALQIYSNFLFDYRIRRVTFEDWAAQCDGPLISWDRDLDSKHPDVPLVLASFEIRSHIPAEDGPFLWTRGGTPWFRLRLGEVVAMQTPERPSLRMLGKGWYPVEANGVWSTKSADLWLPVGDACASGAGCELVVRFSVLPPDASRATTIEARAGDATTTWTVTAATAGTEYHRLDLGTFRAASSGLPVHLSKPDATSPKALGMADDARELGIMLHDLVVIPKEPAEATPSPRAP
jgi:hypothetical protein